MSQIFALKNPRRFWSIIFICALTVTVFFDSFLADSPWLTAGAFFLGGLAAAIGEYWEEIFQKRTKNSHSTEQKPVGHR